MAENQARERAGAKKRKYPRIDLPRGMPGAWQAGGHREVARVATLSLGVIYLTTPNPPTAGTSLQMVFEVPDGDVRARGKLVYVQPGQGMGIQFRGMAAEEPRPPRPPAEAASAVAGGPRPSHGEINSSQRQGYFAQGSSSRL